MPGLDTQVVGSHHYRGAEQRLRGLQAGVTLRLRAEPGNPFDRNAVEVLHDGPPTIQKLGYVPRRYSSLVAGLMRRGVSVRATLLSGSTRGLRLAWADPGSAVASRRVEADASTK